MNRKSNKTLNNQAKNPQILTCKEIHATQKTQCIHYRNKL